jgi:hypothetical protein
MIPSFLSGILVAPNVVDSMTYHFPRYLHWFENGNLEYFYTANARQNVSPILPDLLFAEFYSLFSSDRFLFVPIFLSILVSTFYIYKITLLLTNVKNISILACVLSLFIPNQIAFMSSSQTDPISTALVTILLYYTVLLNKSYSKSYIYFIILMIPLFLTAKTTGLILSIPIYLYVLLSQRKLILNNFTNNFSFFILSILPALPFIFRIWYFGSNAGLGVFVSDFSFSGALLNTSRIIINNLQTPITIVNDLIQSFYYRGTSFLGIDPNPDGFSSYGDFYLSSSLHADLIGNPLHMTVLFFAVIGLWFSGKYRLFIGLILVQFLLIGAFIGWQPWINRFTSTILVVGSIPIGIWLSERQKAFRASLIVILLTYSSFWILFNPSRSLLDPKSLVSVAEKIGAESTDLEKIRYDLLLPREKQYFSVRPEIEKSYILALQEVETLGVDKLYLKIGADDFEYPIWALTDFKLPIAHFQDENLIDVQNGNAYLFCTVDCRQYNLKALFKDKYVSLWW